MLRVQFVPTHLSVRAGTVSFYLVNEEPKDDRLGAYGACPSQLPHCYTHNFVVTDPASNLVGQSDRLAPGQTEVFTVAGLVPGEYGYKCSVQYHDEDYKMVGTLTVT
jgi:hypothetical protein